jgi:hypothetical protein
VLPGSGGATLFRPKVPAAHATFGPFARWIPGSTTRPLPMSSKSRKHTSSPASTHQPDAHSKGKAMDGELEFAEPSEKDFLEDDLKTPKGKSPLTYAFMILLLVFLTVFFILPPTAGQGGGAENPVAVTWTDPVDGPHQMTRTEFQDARARFETTFDFGGATALGALPQLGFFTKPDRLEESDIVRLVMADQQALAAGIAVSDDELVEIVRVIADRVFGGAARYTAQLRQYPNIGGVQGFEDTLRRLLRIRRYVELGAMAATVPERADIEESWHAVHEEHKFEWAKANLADFAEASRAVEPTDDELQAFLDDLSAFEQTQYRTPATFRGDLVGLIVDPDSPREPALLEERYPRPADWDADAEAKAFYTNYYFVIYQRPQPEEGEDATDEEFDTYWTFEEVIDRARRDARAFAALRDWYAELSVRVADASIEVDLEAEAAALGLDFVRVDEPLDLKGWRELGGLSNNMVAGRVSSLTEVGQLSPGVVVGTTGLTIVRLTERVEPFLPPVAELRDELLEPYFEERRIDLAREALVTLRDGLLATEDGESAEPQVATTVEQADFAAAATAAGFEVGVRDWLDVRATEADDPNWSDPVHSLIRSNAQLLSLEAGELSPVLQPFGEIDALYLVRSAGSREMDFARIRPRDFAQARGTAQRDALMAYYASGPFSDVALRDRYSLWLLSEDQKAEMEREAAEELEREAAGEADSEG